MAEWGVSGKVHGDSQGLRFVLERLKSFREHNAAPVIAAMCMTRSPGDLQPRSPLGGEDEEVTVAVLDNGQPGCVQRFELLAVQALGEAEALGIEVTAPAETPNLHRWVYLVANRLRRPREGAVRECTDSGVRVVQVQQICDLLEESILWIEWLLFDLRGTPRATHSPDFTTVNWFGDCYQFVQGMQSGVVRVLWNEWEKGGRGIGSTAIQERVGSCADRFRMSHVFRGHPAWGTMIRCVGRGIYSLKEPKSTK